MIWKFGGKAGRAWTRGAHAKYLLGRRYLHGTGVPRDPASAVEWLDRAAAADHAEAQHLLSMVYLNGISAGGANAAFLSESRVGRTADNARLMFPDGGDVAPDPDLAFAWCRKAADAGLACAQANFGMLHARGIGCAPDPAAARQWYLKAVEQGDAAAATGLAILYEHGLGVAADHEEAVRWYRVAADRGNAFAIAALRRVGIPGGVNNGGQSETKHDRSDAFTST